MQVDNKVQTTTTEETKIVDEVDIHDFCTYSTTYSQTYPFLMVAEQLGKSNVDR